MALKPPKPCRHPGCNALTNAGYCPVHKPKKSRRESEAWHGMYSLPIWTDKLRPEQLFREPFCRVCAKRNMRTYATVVDHVIPHRGDMGLFADPGNLQSLCVQHHNAKSAKEKAEMRRNFAQR